MIRNTFLIATMLVVGFIAGTSTPVVEGQGKTPATANAGRLRSAEIRTRHLMDATVTAGKLAFTDVTVNVSAAAATGSSAADPLLAGGAIIACRSVGNQDQLMDGVVLNGDGSVTVTLAAAATAQNNFKCVVFKPNTKGTS